MTTALWVLPSIDRAWRDECLAGLRAQHVLVVDNAPPNPNSGVTAPWNIARRTVVGLGFDYLVICSEAVRFGPAGGLDLEAELRDQAIVLTQCVGWHLVALARWALDEVGEFDQRLPFYGQDRDYMVRMHLAGLPSPGYSDLPVPQFTVDAYDAGVAHSITDGFVTVHFSLMTAYLACKWGDPAPGCHYPTPFNA